MKKTKEPAFEDRIERLQAIVKILEGGGSSLEESVALYKEGLEHAVACRRQLEQARHDIKICTEEGELPFAGENGEPFAPQEQRSDLDEDDLPF